MPPLDNVNEVGGREKMLEQDSLEEKESFVLS